MQHRLRSIILLAGLLGGCQLLAVATAPSKQPSPVRSATAVAADALFWDRFHAGDYAAIPSLLTALQAAYLGDPDDAVTAGHIGWVQIWRLSEAGRVAQPGPAIVDAATLSREYFADAYELRPDDARLLGFYASATMAEAAIHHDEKETREGYYRMMAAVRAYPEFNLFTAGYVLSDLPRGSARFAQALDMQWRNLDLCVGRKVDRRNPDYAPYLRAQTTVGPKRVCWNSAIAPHNFEGFFLNFGDMLVKSGDWQTARTMYGNARLSSDYAAWPFRAVLERRIAEAQANVAAFNEPRATPLSGDPERRLMVQTQFSCMACHQQT